MTGRTVVTYYDPFTHFYAADVVRMFVLTWALALAASVILLAWRRYEEGRQSATLFLLALTLAHVTFGVAGISALGRPPVWIFLALELVVLALSSVACWIVVGEARRGVWARRT